MIRKTTRTNQRHTRCAIAIGGGLALVVILFVLLADSGEIRGRRTITFCEKPFRIEIQKKFMGIPLDNRQLDFPEIERAYQGHSWQVAGRTYESTFRFINLGVQCNCSEFGWLNFDLITLEGHLASSKRIPAPERLDAVLLNFVEHRYGDLPAGSIQDLWAPASAAGIP
jgi:hypothetical protein